MAWGKWRSDGTGEHVTEKVTKTSEGSKHESLRTNDGSRSDHQHTWVSYNSHGKPTGGGATPGKKSK